MSSKRGSFADIIIIPDEESFKKIRYKMAKLTIPEIILALFFVDKPYANVNCIDAVNQGNWSLSIKLR